MGDIKVIEITAAPTLYERPIPELINDDFALAAFGSVLTLSSNIPLASPFDKTFVVDATMWFVSSNPALPGSGDAINGLVTKALQFARDYINIANTLPTEMQIRIDYKVYERHFLFFKGWKQKTYIFPYKPGGMGLPTQQQYERGINNAIKNFPGG